MLNAPKNKKDNNIQIIEYETIEKQIYCSISLSW